MNNNYQQVPSYMPFQPSSNQNDNYDYYQNPYQQQMPMRAINNKIIMTRSQKFDNIFDSTDVTHSCLPTEIINPSNSNFNVVEHLDLANFKSKPCQQQQQHNHKHCPFYHNSKDRKRIGNFYSADLCEYIEKGEQCPYGDMCLRSHNRVEQLYQPDKYKTKFCTYYPNNLAQCDYGSYCSFAHNETDIVIELIHNLEYDDDFYMFYFKTVWCPFNLTPHDKALCVYAHNWQDYRRKPNVYQYEPIPCPNWKATEFIINYTDGCINQLECTKCHGWKEHEYHPKNYKTKNCQYLAQQCPKGRDCPNYHGQKDKRFVPKNRIITNTFKKRCENIMMNNQMFLHNQGFSSLQLGLSPLSPSPNCNLFMNKGNHMTQDQIQLLQNQAYVQHSSQILDDQSTSATNFQQQQQHQIKIQTNQKRGEKPDDEKEKINKNWLSGSQQLNNSFSLDEDDKQVYQQQQPPIERKSNSRQMIDDQKLIGEYQQKQLIQQKLNKSLLIEQNNCIKENQDENQEYDQKEIEQQQSSSQKKLRKRSSSQTNFGLNIENIKGKQNQETIDNMFQEILISDVNEKKIANSVKQEDNQKSNAKQNQLVKSPQTIKEVKQEKDEEADSNVNKVLSMIDDD